MRPLTKSMFLKVTAEDLGKVLVKRFAHVTRDGTPTQLITDLPLHKYVLEIVDRSGKVDAGIQQSAGLVNQAKVCPPVDWLESVGASPESFAQQTLDHFTLILHSTLDRVLMLAKYVFEIQLDDRMVTYKRTHRELMESNPQTASLIKELRDSVLPIAEYRNSYAHRGEERYVSQFSTLVRLKAIVKSFGAPVEGIRLEQADANSNLVRVMEENFDSVSAKTVSALDSMIDNYRVRRERLGNLDDLSRDELRRATEVEAYFAGGPRPGFMDEM